MPCLPLGGGRTIKQLRIEMSCRSIRIVRGFFRLTRKCSIMAFMRTILMGGIKHCGKTTLGRIAADRLGYDFFDLDELTVGEGMGTWGSARELMNNFGADGFRELEAMAVTSLIGKTIPELTGKGVVLSLGGGTIENTEAMAALRGTMVYLLAPCELLYQRIDLSGKPAFLSMESPYEDFLNLYKRRDILYRKFADLIHEVDESPKELNAERLLLALEDYHGGK